MTTQDIAKLDALVRKWQELARLLGPVGEGGRCFGNCADELAAYLIMTHSENR